MLCPPLWGAGGLQATAQRAQGPGTVWVCFFFNFEAPCIFKDKKMPTEGYANYINHLKCFIFDKGVPYLPHLCISPPDRNHFELFRQFIYLPHIINNILLQLFTS